MIERLIRTFVTVTYTGIAAVAMFSSSLAQTAASDREVFLKPDITVTGEDITLTDLFSEAGEKGHIVVASAPIPGESLTLAARHLQALAKENNLQWSNGADTASVTVKRDARTITYKEILPELNRQLLASGGPVDVDIQLADQNFKVNIAKDAESDFEITQLDYDRRTGSLKADLHFPGAGKDGVDRTIQGRAFAVRTVPVLNRYLEAGEKIEAEDLSWESFRVSQIGRTTIASDEILIGTEAKRPLEPGRPLRETDVRVPILLAKDQLVTIYYQIPGLTLSVEGRAMEHGGANQTVRVLNTRSHRTILARVIGPNEVLASSASASTEIKTSAYSAR